jgi:hypothetical protein
MSKSCPKCGMWMYKKWLPNNILLNKPKDFEKTMLDFMIYKCNCGWQGTEQELIYGK